MYYNYHAKIKKMIKEDKLICWYYTDDYPRIGRAIVLIFDDINHHKMPIRPHKFEEYMKILPEDKNTLFQ